MPEFPKKGKIFGNIKKHIEDPILSPINISKYFPNRVGINFFETFQKPNICEEMF
jgi:hypothetical protein